MLQKNIERNDRKKRQTWTGYYTRKTKTKQDKINQQLKKETLKWKQ